MCIKRGIKSLTSLVMGSVVFIICSSHALANEPIFLGILENFNKQELSNQKQNNSINPRARIPFFKEGEHWKAMKSNYENSEELRESILDYPLEVKWLVINNGNYLGNLLTRQSTPHWYSDVGIHQIIGNLSEKFQLPPVKNLNFPVAKMAHKPLVMISEFSNYPNNFSDSEGWVISKLNDQEIKLVLRGILLNNKNTLSKHPYTNEDVQVIECYRSKDHGVVVNTLVKNISQFDDNFFVDTQNWFYIPKELKNASAQFIGAGLSLIEKTDIDYDGRTEWIFLYSDPNNADENTNGYILFYNDFKQSTRYVWNNH